MSWTPGYSEEEVRDAVRVAHSLADALRRLGLRPVGGNYRTLRKLLAFYGVATDHMDPNWVRRGRRPRAKTPLDQVLVEGSTYSRGDLKRRLYEEGLKARRCELCGQGEVWHQRPMALILDHINGVGDDNRLENLRIVCPNCAATLDTHCGRKNRIDLTPRSCLYCSRAFVPKYPTHRYCSHACGVHYPGSPEPHPERRKVDRPPYDQLMAELEATSYSAVGRKHGVSDNAVRKWVRWYRARGEVAVHDGFRAEHNPTGLTEDPPHEVIHAPEDGQRRAGSGTEGCCAAADG